MKTPFILAAALTALSFSSAFAGDADTLYIPASVPYMEGLRVRQNIKDDCALEQRIADDVAHNAGSVYSRVVREKPTGAHHVLEMEITDVFGAGGGSWSGPKNLEVRGTLKDQSGKSLGTFTARRYSMGGVMGGLKGTCGILRRISKALGKDIATFLVAPEHGVSLGD